MRMAAIFVAIFVLVGLGIAGYGVFVVWQATETASWPGVEGRIVKSEIVTDHDSDGMTYAAEIHYLYEADGASRTGTRLFVGDGVSSSDRTYADGLCRRYPVGAVVQVHHDPFDPDSAVLEPGVSRKAFIPLAFGLGFALFGGWFGLLFWLFTG